MTTDLMNSWGLAPGDLVAAWFPTLLPMMEADPTIRELKLGHWQRTPPPLSGECQSLAGLCISQSVGYRSGSDVSGLFGLVGGGLTGSRGGHALGFPGPVPALSGVEY